MNVGESDILQGLDPKDAQQLLDLGTSKVYPVGTMVFDIGDEAESLFLVLDGRVDLSLPIRVGGRPEDVPVEERVAGQALGWSALTPPFRFTLRATVGIEAEMLALPREALLRVFAQQPDVGWRVMANVAEIVGQRFQVFQAMWLRQIQYAVERRHV